MFFFLFLLSGAVIAFVIAFWKNRFETKDDIDEISSNSTASAPATSTWSTTPRAPEGSSSTWSPRSNTDSLSVNSVSRDIFNNFPHSLVIQKRILVNLRVVEYKLTELENFPIVKGFKSSLVIEKSTEEVTRCNVNRVNH